MGGAKIADKVKLINGLLTSTKCIMLGSGMSIPFLKIEGKKVGKSLCD